MGTFRLTVVHSLPSAIRFAEGVVPTLAGLWSRAARRSNDALTEPNAILSAIDKTQSRIGMAPSLMRVITPVNCLYAAAVYQSRIETFISIIPSARPAANRYVHKLAY